MSKLRLERLIEIKEKLKEDKERTLEHTKAALEEMTNDIERIRSELEVTHNSIGTSRLDGKSFGDIRDYMAYLEAERMNLLERQEKTRKIIEVLSGEFIELAREIKMLEKLQSKAQKELKKSENRREQKFLDDLALRTDERKG